MCDGWVMCDGCVMDVCWMCAGCVMDMNPSHTLPQMRQVVPGLVMWRSSTCGVSAECSRRLSNHIVDHVARNSAGAVHHAAAGIIERKQLHPLSQIDAKQQQYGEWDG